MADIIALLPDRVANQIAAGEVIQRPASVVKELVENSIDAGSTCIKVIVKEAGRALIQVVDNGFGMSETDARMSFERHSTSKIRQADDLFKLHTKGFRGEALASVAAVAHVALKTRIHDEELGTHITLEGSEIKTQELCSCPAGTSFSVKNLFYNVPVRRNFLKSNQVEMRHIIEEFQRLALTHPEVELHLIHNGNAVFNLPEVSLRRRIVGIFGKKYNQKLVPVSSSTDIIRIAGFVGKPEFARKTKGEQYFFANGRFIRHHYLGHAVVAAFEELIPKGMHPSYFLFLEVEPSAIDVNIHPTKTEIKFEDERAIYAILRSAVRQSLGQYNISPTLDFDQETSFNVSPSMPSGEIKPPVIHVNPDYNPFESEKKPDAGPNTTAGYSSSSDNKPPDRSAAGWQDLYKVARDWEAPEGAEDTVEVEITKTETATQQVISSSWGTEQNERESRITVQLHRRYILTSIKSGFILIDQHRAHQRILFDELMETMQKQENHSQQQLFPQTVALSSSDFELLKTLEADVNALGFDIAEFGKNTYVINGIPADASGQDPGHLLDALLEQYKLNANELKLDRREHLARVLARNMAIRPGKDLGKQEMQHLADALFACEIPYYTPSGKPVMVTFPLEEIEKRFEK